PTPGLGAASGPAHQLAVLEAGSGHPTAGGTGPARPAFATWIPPHRPLDGRGRAGGSGFPLVPAHPEPTAGVRVDGDAPEWSPPHLSDDRRGVGRRRLSTSDVTGRRARSGDAPGPPRRSNCGRVRAAARSDPAVGLDDLPRRIKHRPGVAGLRGPDGRPAGNL